MRTEKLDPARWEGYFDRVTKLIEGRQAMVEVMSLALGDQVQAEWVPLLGISYDPKGRIVEVALQDLDHMIRDPREIHVASDGEGMRAIEIVGADGTKQVVRLRTPLLLEAVEQ